MNERLLKVENRAKILEKLEKINNHLIKQDHIQTEKIDKLIKICDQNSKEKENLVQRLEVLEIDKEARRVTAPVANNPNKNKSFNKDIVRKTSSTLSQSFANLNIRDNHMAENKGKNVGIENKNLYNKL